jgi:hypothetical protein
MRRVVLDASGEGEKWPQEMAPQSYGGSDEEVMSCGESWGE